MHFENFRNSPYRLFLALLTSIFLVEGLIMLALPHLPVESETIRGALDATVLTIALFPMLYILVFQGLDEKNKELMKAQLDLVQINSTLEQRVHERTEALNKANEHIQLSLERIATEQKMIAALGQLGRVLHACRSEDETFRIATDRLQHLLPGHSGALYLLDESRDLLARAFEWHDVKWIDFFTPESCWALRLGRPYLSNPGSEAACRHHSSADIQTACMPLFARGEILGVLSIAFPETSRSQEDSQTPDEFGSGKHEFFSALAETLALVISNLRLRQTLEGQALHDQLTGLHNRFFLREQLALEIGKSDRSGQPLSVIMYDIDHFKRFNDLYGHDAGDSVLITLGRFIKSHARAGDISCRYGGEEFMIVMPNTDTEIAMQRAHDILKGAESLSIEHGGISLGPISMSAGVATYPADGKTIGELLHAGDMALYASKQAGRNRVSRFIPQT